MKIAKSKNSSHQIVYTAELSEYDAEPPTRKWILDGGPNRINPEIEAIALYLIFGPWCGGEFICPQKMGPNTAAAITRHSQMDFFPGPIEYYPKPLPTGVNEVTVSEEFPQPGVRTLSLMSADKWNGAMRSTNSMILSSNSAVFGTGPEDPRTILAPAVLMAEELGVGTIVVPSGDGAWATDLVQLCSEVRLVVNSKDL